MAVSLDSNNTTATQASSGAEFLTAAVAKSQQELEGEMALQLIQSVSPESEASASTSIGSHINIKV